MKTFTSRKRQAGVSVSGWIGIIIVVVIFANAGVKIIPAFMEYNTISGTIQNVISDRKAGLLSENELKADIGKRFVINNVEAVSVSDLEILKENGELIVKLDYEVRKNFIKNVDFVISFKHDFQKSIR